VPEAALRVDRNPETVRRWIRSGRLRASKVGTQHVIDEQDLARLDEYIEPVEIPEGWRYFKDGTPQPDWQRLLREDRDSH